MRKLWSFRSLDTLFFRDGTPFHQGEVGGASPKSQFPPTMVTMQGAIRTTLASKQGWSPQHPDQWPEQLGTPDDLGDIRLSGPYLRWMKEPLFPAPFLLFGERKQDQKNWNLTRLTPGKPVDSDLGDDLRFPQLSEQIEGDMFQGWLTRTGLEAVLRSELPEYNDMYQTSELWKEESKIGIARNQVSRVTEEGQLYTLSHVRPNNQLDLMVGVEGIPTEWHPSAPHGITLGGEGKFAELRVTDWPKKWFPIMPTIPLENGKLRFTVSLLTPGYYEHIEQVITAGPPNVPGTCVSASIGKIMSVGGWDLERARPRPMKSLIPAGSTWFFEAAEENREQIEHLHGICSGEMTAYGMGQMVMGIWRDQEESICKVTS